VEITYPTEGTSVSGLITVTGTVDFPNFMKYELFLRTGSEMLWAATVHGPVINGNLARMDTRIYPDGIYQLIVRTVRTDSNYNEYVVASFLIENELGAPQPFPEIISSPLYPPLAGTLVRFRNCGGDNLEVDYHSPTGFCSADDLWIPFKNQYSPVCPYVDVLLIPECEYRGTARGQGQPKGVGYSFLAEKGKIYEIIHSGDVRISVTEIPGDVRADTDTGGLDPEDPARYPTASGVAVDSSTVAEPSTAAETEAEQAPAQPAETPTDSDGAQDTQEMLPVSGQGRVAGTSFVVVAMGLIVFLVIGGIVALRKRGHQA
jgi:hypothetical protein